MAAAAAAVSAAPAVATSAEKTTTSIVVMLFNVLAGCWTKPSWFPGVDATKLLLATRLPLNIKAIVNASPDVVCMQEVDATSHPVFKKALHDAGYLLSELSFNFPSSSPIKNGTAVAVKNELVTKTTAIQQWWIEDAGITLTEIADFPLIANVHLDRQGDGGEKQLKALMNGDVLRDVDSSVVVGDWNIKQEDMKAVTKSFANAGAIITPAGSVCFPPTQSAMKLDHACCVGTMAKVEEVPEADQKWRDETFALSTTNHAGALTRALERYGSDHLPVRIRIFKRAETAITTTAKRQQRQQQQKK